MRKKVKWITVVGWSPIAALNGLWHEVRRGIFPAEIALLRSEGVENEVESFKKCVEALFKVYFNEKVNIKEVKFEENDPMGFRSKVLNEIENSNYDVILDMTPGRKFISGFMLSLGRHQKVTKIVYVHLFDRNFENVPLPLIPRNKQKIYDFKNLILQEEEKGA